MQKLKDAVTVGLIFLTIAVITIMVLVTKTLCSVALFAVGCRIPKEQEAGVQNKNWPAWATIFNRKILPIHVFLLWGTLGLKFYPETMSTVFCWIFVTGVVTTILFYIVSILDEYDCLFSLEGYGAGCFL